VNQRIIDPASRIGRRRLLKGAAALAAVPLFTALPAFIGTRFQQFSEQGGLSRGYIYLRRPGQLRVDYDPPVPVLIVSDGLMVTYFDEELDQRNQVPLSSSPLWFLLRPNVRLNRDVTVSKVERAPGALRITMFQTEEPDAGTVSLVFRDPPLELLHWYLKDAQGQEVQVALYDTEFGIELANALFATPRIEKLGTKGNR
jgi:outer membrane lipoprotein-sorting protein